MNREQTKGAVAQDWVGRETVLLAEDDQVIRELLSEILQDNGYRVVEACDGEDAIAKFEQHQESIELAILDVIMPRLNGREVYRMITTEKPSLRVIFTSGYPAYIFSDKVMLGTELNFLSKPVAPQTLLSMMRKVLDGSPCQHSRRCTPVNL